jgi:hypothetical protein
MQIEIPELTPVDSSQIEAIGHNPAVNVLFVRFHPRVADTNGPVYAYFEFSAEKFKDFLKAESKGKFLNKEIRDKFKYQKLTA